MSSRSKGNRSERKAVEELEKEGYNCYRVKGSSIWNKNVDMFSDDKCPGFDICAKKGYETRWIQIKTNRYVSLEHYREFYNKYCSPFEKIEVWNWIDRKGFRKSIFNEVKEVDEEILEEQKTE